MSSKPTQHQLSSPTLPTPPRSLRGGGFAHKSSQFKRNPKTKSTGPYIAPPPLPHAAPYRRPNHSRKFLNSAMRAAVQDLLSLNRQGLIMQFTLRSLYRRQALTMEERRVHRDVSRLVARMKSARDMITVLKRQFVLLEAEARATLLFVGHWMKEWREGEGIEGPDMSTHLYPRVFGRSERRMFRLLGRLLDSWGDVHDDVGCALRGFYDANDEKWYCGMQ